MTERSHRPADASIARRIDTELRMLTDAVELVRSGASARVTLGGLQYGDQLLDRAKALATSAGLDAVGIYGTDESSGTDIAIEHASAASRGVEP